MSTCMHVFLDDSVRRFAPETATAQTVERAAPCNTLSMPAITPRIKHILCPKTRGHPLCWILLELFLGHYNARLPWPALVALPRHAPQTPLHTTAKSHRSKGTITVISLRLVRNIILLTGSGNSTLASPILSVPPTMSVHLMHLSAACFSTNLSLHVSTSLTLQSLRRGRAHCRIESASPKLCALIINE
ncbi:hypothetical protein DPSP01_012582 [Paraphaeosphaeria sporulosa]